MKIEDFLTQFVEDLDSEALLIWAEIHKLNPDIGSWLDDDFPDKEDELRVELTEVMIKAWKA